ncbi:MAG: hypothetical protein VB957_12385 [Pseudomonadales bacterium]
MSTRNFWYRIPDAQEATAKIAVPLVVLFHPDGSNGSRMVNRGGYLAHSEANHYAIAAPNAVDGKFNIAASDNEVQFIDDMIQTMTADPRVDADKIYLIGFSAGATMALITSIHSKLKFSGIAAVAGQPTKAQKVDLRGGSILDAN